MVNNKALTLPLKVLVSFMILTQLLYFWGPIQFESQFNALLFLSFIVIDFFFLFGFKRGLRKRLQYNGGIGIQYTKGTEAIIIIGILLIIPQYFNGWNLDSFDPQVILNRLIIGLNNPGLAFNERNAAMGTSSFTYLLMLLSPLSISAKVLSIYFWKDLGRKMKIVVVLYYLLVVVYWLGVGTRKGLFDIAIILFFTIILSNPNWVLSKRNIKKLFGIALLSILLFVLYFIYSNLSRFGLNSSEIVDVDYYSIKDSYKALFPPAFNVILAQLTSYLCQGYYAFSVSLSEWFNNGLFCFSYGIGSNWFKISVMERIFPDVDFLSLTYQGYLATHYGINPEASWHSLYLWLANDVTFLGVPILIYILSYYCGYFWNSALHKYRIIDAPIAILFIMVFAYSFANNQVFSFSFISFWALLFIRVFKK